MDGAGIDNQVDIRGDIFRSLAIGNAGSFFLQIFGQGRTLAVRTGNGKTGIQQNLGKTAHADTADTDKMYMNGIFKINLIHNNRHLLLYKYI